MSFWGFSFVWVKIVYYYYQPITTVFLRLSIATIILFSIKKIFKIGLRPKKKDIKYFFLLALFEPFIYFLGESFGLKYVNSTVASLMVGTIPVFTPLVAYFVIKEHLSVFNFIGILISFVGIMIMVIEPDFSLKANPFGILLMLVAVAGAVGSTLIVKKLSGKYKAYTILSWQTLFGALLFLPLFLIFDLSNFLTVKPDLKVVMTLLELTVFATILAFFFFIKVVDKLGVSKTNVFTNFIPIVTAITAYFVLPEEEVNARIFMGIFVTLIGIFIAQKRSLKYDKRT